MSDTTHDATEELRFLDEAAKEARREHAASAAMLAMGIVYSIGFIMGGLVCGLAGILVGWMIWG